MAFKFSSRQVADPEAQRNFEQIEGEFTKRLAVVTALPAGPVDGQEIAYAPFAGGIWRFKYNATAGKWDFAGGPPLVAALDTGTARGVANAFGDLATVGPSVVVPFAGDYVADSYATATSTGAAAGNLYGMGPFRGVTQGSPPNFASWNAPAAAYKAPLVHLGEAFAGCAAGDTLKLQYYSQVSITSTFGPCRIAVYPRRVG